MIIKFAYNLMITGKPKDEKGNEYFKGEEIEEKVKSE